MASTEKDLAVPSFPQSTEWRGDGDYFYPVPRPCAHEVAAASEMAGSLAHPASIENVLKTLGDLKAELVRNADDAARWTSRIESLEAEIRQIGLAQVKSPQPESIEELKIAGCRPMAPVSHWAVA